MYDLTRFNIILTLKPTIFVLECLYYDNANIRVRGI